MPTFDFKYYFFIQFFRYSLVTIPLVNKDFDYSFVYSIDVKTFLFYPRNPKTILIIQMSDDS